MLKVLIIRKSTWANVTTKVPDQSDEMDMEMIHLRLNCLPALHIIGVYLDCAPTVNYANNVQARLEAKLESITSKDEDCILMGDLNRPMDKSKELQKTRIMKAWIDLGKVMLLNDPKVHTRIRDALLLKQMLWKHG